MKNMNSTILGCGKENAGDMPTGDELNYVSGTKAALRTARKVKFDEFYTPLYSIEAELAHYKDCFKDKVVYCNTDYVCNANNVHDNRNSAFFTYFYEQFERLGLKALICTWLEEGSNKLHGLRYTGNGNSEYFSFPDSSGGAYDGPVAEKFLDACDIVVTNPPFSVFKDFFKFVVAHNKPYLLVAPGTCPTYKDVFPELMNDRCRFGYTSLSKFFTTRDKPEHIKATVDSKTGRVMISSNSMWLTSLNLNKRPDPIMLWNTYEDGKFLHYYNLENSINCPSFNDIPKDWPGMIGVNVSFFASYNPEQFKVWGLGVGNLMLGIPGIKRLDKKFVDDYKAAGGRGAYTENFPILGYYEDGIAKIPFARVIIQNRKFLDT